MTPEILILFSRDLEKSAMVCLGIENLDKNYPSGYHQNYRD